RQLVDVMRGHLLLDAVGAEAFDTALHVKSRLVDGIAEARTGIAAHDQTAALGHERAHMANRTADHDVDAFHRDAAAKAGSAVDGQQPAAPPCTARRRAAAFAADFARHHVLGNAVAAAAVHDAGPGLVNAG